MTERHFKISGSPAIYFIPQVLGEEDVGEMMILDLQLTSAPSKVSFKDDVAKVSGGGDDEYGDETKPPTHTVEEVKNTYKQRFRKLCNGTTEDYLKWVVYRQYFVGIHEQLRKKIMR